MFYHFYDKALLWRLREELIPLKVDYHVTHCFQGLDVIFYGLYRTDY